MSDDVVIPPDLVAAQQRAHEAFRAVGAWTEEAPDTLPKRPRTRWRTGGQRCTRRRMPHTPCEHLW